MQLGMFDHLSSAASDTGSHTVNNTNDNTLIKLLTRHFTEQKSVRVAEMKPNVNLKPSVETDVPDHMARMDYTRV